MALKIFKADDNKIVGVGSKVNKTFKNLSRSKKLKNKKFINPTYIRAVKKPIFLIFNTEKTFNYLKQVFIKVLIFW